MENVEKSKDFQIIKQVGEGSFGQVYKASRKRDGAIVAFKVTQKVSYLLRLLCFCACFSGVRHDFPKKGNFHVIIISQNWFNQTK